MNIDERWARFEKEGEENVSKKFRQEVYGQPGSVGHSLVKGWLQHKEQEREQFQAIKQEERQQTIDQEARDQARFSKRIAVVALGVSIIGFLINLLLQLIWD